MTMTIATLHINTIKSKKDLHKLYDMQMSIREVNEDIGDILKKTRDLPAGMRSSIQILKPKEVLLFIIDNGFPNGYFPDSEVQMKLDDLRRVQREEKHHERALQENSLMKKSVEL